MLLTQGPPAPAHMAHRANSHCSPGPPSVCRHSTPLHAASGGLRKCLRLAPGGLHPPLTKRLHASFLAHLQALGAVHVEASLGLGAEIRCRTPLCQQPPVRPQPGPSLVPAAVSSGVKRSDSFPPTGSGLQQSKRCEPAGRGGAASRACPPAFCPPPAPAPSS